MTPASVAAEILPHLAERLPVSAAVVWAAVVASEFCRMVAPEGCDLVVIAESA